jgi:hypothetical protein
MPQQQPRNEARCYPRSGRQALTEVGLKSENVTRIMAGASKLPTKDIDAAMRSKAKE